MVGNAGAGAANCIGNRGNRLFLTDDAFGQKIFHMNQFFLFAFKHLVNRNACPLGNNRGNALVGNDFPNVTFGVFGLFLNILQFLFQLRNNAVLKFAGTFIASFPFGNVNFYPRLVQLVLDFGNIGQALFFFFPFVFQTFGLGLKPGNLITDEFQTLSGLFVVFLFECLTFNFQLQNTAVKFIKFFRFGINRHTQRTGCLVHQVDSLVGQKTVADVTVGQGGGGNKRAVGNAHAVMKLELVLDAAQYGNGFFNARFGNENRLETTSQSGVLFNIFFILRQGRCAQTMKFAPGQRRFEQV